MELAVKKELYAFCQSYVDGRISRIKSHMLQLQESLDSETKSSAGDKHETGRAMLQLELEKSGEQLAAAEGLKSALQQIRPAPTSPTIGSGSLVNTSKANYFISISAGEYNIGALKVFCISTNTPIGLLLLGKSKGATVHFRDELITILEVT